MIIYTLISLTLSSLFGFCGDIDVIMTLVHAFWNVTALIIHAGKCDRHHELVTGSSNQLNREITGGGYKNNITKYDENKKKEILNSNIKIAGYIF